jgi:3-oxoacyl-[acyl-carrier protein] reductase
MTGALGEVAAVGKLSGKVALVTGASRGIGRSIAEAYAREGSRLFLVGNRDRAALDSVLRNVRDRGVEAAGGLYDVGDPDDVRKMADAIEEAFGTLDVAVNNAGVIKMTPILDITPEQFENTVRVHLLGSFLVLREMTLRFLKPKGKGKIINVSSIGAIRAGMHTADYSSAKGGIIALTRIAAKELAPYNIQVNAVLPIASTRMTDAIAEEFPHDAARIAEFPGPDAVAPTFVFLASDDSDYVSAQMIGVDGGRSA